jgi:hypothetical protein
MRSPHSGLLVTALVCWGQAAQARAQDEHADPRSYTASVDIFWPEGERSRAEVQRPRERAEVEPVDVSPGPDEPVEPRETQRRASFDLELSGLLGAVITHRTGGFTFGGPRLGLRVGHFAIGLSFYPTLTYSTYRDRHRIQPNLGFGLEVAYRGVTLFAPVYHLEDRYLPAFGIGYRFHLVRTVPRRERNRGRRKRADR